MKKALFILLAIASLTACGGKKEEVRKTPSQEGTMVEVAEVTENNSAAEIIQSGEEMDDLQSAYEKNIEGICVIDEVRELGDPELEQLYGDLALLQERADEWAKLPRSLDELEEITNEIGRLKGRIAYRSLRIHSALN
ncbi:hypothetical protein PM10SUCC1_22750 [Propionigenium maris DSM 9537]|uniref:Lipoprotein n=1 Tax=Propionigenium maris DSM 9537 TaxID=1123000 RepID=A0A9W6LMX2_9FUSO|nr:hypothetical protein [Propionigenium maris]GLI56761.1 hypothetical protein PM10SUCC1_22750 [Propionigenium maris DSM 9537]